MGNSNGTGPNTPNFTGGDNRNKPAYTLKGGLAEPDNAILTGFIETDLDEKFFDNRKTIRSFIVKRKVGGKEINGRKIKGWKEVPIVLDWDSTYRVKDWQENFSELAKKFKEKPISDWFEQGDLNNKQKEHNHALCVFINSFLTKENERTGDIKIEQMLKSLHHKEIVENHAEFIYLNDQYSEPNDQKHQIVNGKKIPYDEFQITTYEQVVDIWMDYLERMEETKVFQADMQREKLLPIDVKHRWKEEYTNKMLAKFKDLQESKYADMWTCMLSITSYQDKVDGEPETPEDWQHNHRGLSWFETMQNLKESLDKILDMLRQLARRELDADFHYVWIVEAHKTGYPHLHVAIFGDVAEWLDTYKNQLRVREILEKEHDIGKEGIATDFETRPPSGEGAVNDLSNYLMKYMQKNFGEIKSKYESKTLENKDWGTLVYNACMWLSGYRTWGTSRSVGSVMKTEKVVSEKEYEKLGGELTDSTDRDFRLQVNAKGSELLNKRMLERDKFRKAISDRQNN